MAVILKQRNELVFPKLVTNHDICTRIETHHVEETKKNIYFGKKAIATQRKYEYL